MLCYVMRGVDRTSFNRAHGERIGFEAGADSYSATKRESGHVPRRPAHGEDEEEGGRDHRNRHEENGDELPVEAEAARGEALCRDHLQCTA
jgi:hypothetical protein